MARDRSRQPRAPRPLDPARLEEIALAYVARFATSAAKLHAYLARKLRERGWDSESAPDPAALVERYVVLGYIDDAAYARAKSGSLLRRGYGERRVDQALYAAGIADEVRDEVRAAPEEARRAALALASRRRFGPYGPPGEREGRDKQLAAMLRAGHSFAAARAVVDAPSIAALEEWAAEPEESP
jgi:regulatory protein